MYLRVDDFALQRLAGQHHFPHAAFKLAHDGEELAPIGEAGSGAVQERERAYLNEIIEQVNDLFGGDLTNQDELVYANRLSSISLRQNR